MVQVICKGTELDWLHECCKKKILQSKFRWTVRTSALDSVLKNYSTLLETLEEVSQGYDEYARCAGGQMALMEKFSTYFGLRLSYTVFGAAEQLSRIIQAKQISIQDAVKAAHTVLQSQVMEV